MSEITLAEAARRAGVTPATLRRWATEGLIPQYDGHWTLAAAAHARIVARLRERGHSLEDIRRASEGGVLAFAYVEDLFPPVEAAYTLEEATEEAGLEPALIERLWAAVGFNAQSLERLT
jgi:adenylate cyclase